MAIRLMQSFREDTQELDDIKAAIILSDACTNHKILSLISRMRHARFIK